MSPIVSGNFRQNKWGRWRFARRLKAGEFLFSISSLGEILKAKREQKKTAGGLFKFILQLPRWLVDWAQKPNGKQQTWQTQQRQTQTGTATNIHTPSHTYTHTEPASCGCANQKCRKDESIKNIYMRVHFCISLLAMTETVRVVVSLSLSLSCCCCLCRHCFILTVHTHTHT